MKILVRRLSLTVTQKDLATIFGRYGDVESVYIPTFPDTGMSLCLAYVVMPNVDDGEAAIAATHYRMLKGRHMEVCELGFEAKAPPAIVRKYRSHRDSRYVRNTSRYSGREPRYARDTSRYSGRIATSSITWGGM